MATSEDEPQSPADEQPAAAPEEEPALAQNPPDTTDPETMIANEPADHNTAPDNDDESDTDSSSSDAASDREADAPAPAVEWLATGREKRSTAGNRLKHMLAAQEPDDELELLFAEDGDDAAFSEADEDGSDLHMDSSSDDEDAQEQGDDLEGEKELERKARENRQAARKRKAQEAIPLKFRKKVKIATGPQLSAEGSVTSSSAATPTTSTRPPGGAPRPKKKSERTSWLPTPAEMPTRASRRETTMLSKEQLHQQMIEREVKRIKQVEAMERKAKKMEALRKPPKTQAERLAEAAVIEKKNAKSLNRWEEAEKQREEERRAKLAALNNRTLDGPVVTFWSGVGEWVDGKLKYVGKIVTIEEKPLKKKRGSALDGDATLPGTNEDVPMADGVSKEEAASEQPTVVETAPKPDIPALNPTTDPALEASTTSSEKPPMTSTTNQETSNPAETLSVEQDTQSRAAEPSATEQPSQVVETGMEPAAAQPATSSQQASPSPPVVDAEIPATNTAAPNPDPIGVVPDSQANGETPDGRPAPDLAAQTATEDSQTQPVPHATLEQHPPQQGAPSLSIETAESPTTTTSPKPLSAADIQKQEPLSSGTAEAQPDVEMKDVAVSLPDAAAPVRAQPESQRPPTHSDAPSQLVSSEPTASATSTYTTMSFAPPAQLVSVPPPDGVQMGSSFLARPAGISPGGLSIPQIGQMPIAGAPGSFPAPAPMNGSQQTSDSGPQLPPGSPAVSVALAQSQQIQPVLQNGRVDMQAPSMPEQQRLPLAPPPPTKPARGGRQKKEKEKEETPPPPRTPPPDGKATRNCFILQNFNENAIKDKAVQTKILFGKEMNKLPKPAPAPRCVITGQPARYKDPKTGLPYYNSFAYKEIQKLQKGEYKFSKLLGTWMGTGSAAALGVPARFLDPTAPGPPKPVPAATVAEQPAANPTGGPTNTGGGSIAHTVADGTAPGSTSASGAASANQPQLSGTTPVPMPPPAPSPAVQTVPPSQSAMPVADVSKDAASLPAPAMVPQADTIGTSQAQEQHPIGPAPATLEMAPTTTAQDMGMTPAPSHTVPTAKI
ncbi:YL1 nuclear protein-domain-containing protein [Microdochium trichocladiopsis]|uniref:YL1 nuclear protein-domain-containing protein n=1 Tax=Microdochium trichocladiopsis TaxID=1682393 RepID=A0A9P8YJP9_9PEZI|nr:YL1 nuclear protein-domain-containing protein [Microdochium trichocladiopsis]KAH7041133.1 YL1 nuclear protein-domain-containing protein [Microdochium trichocladiopsis]